LGSRELSTPCERFTDPKVLGMLDCAFLLLKDWGKDWEGWVIFCAVAAVAPLLAPAAWSKVSDSNLDSVTLTASEESIPVII